VSVAFRREFLGASAIIRVDAAFGADLRLNSLGWTWTDITSDVLYADYAGVSISPMGRSDGDSTAPPSGFAFSLKNTTGNYTVDNPSGAYYPNVARQTPVRVVMNFGASDIVRAQGYANGWVPSWDTSGRFAIVKVSCSGALRRLNQGSPAIQSAIYRSTVNAPGLVTFASLEDDSGSTSIAVQITRQPQNALTTGTVTFGGDSTLGGAKQAIVLSSSSYLGLATQGHSFGGHWQVDWFYKFTGSAPAAETAVMRCWAGSGNVAFIDAVYGAGNWGIRVYDRAGTSLGSAIFSPPAGQQTGWWHWRVFAQDGGSGGTDYKLVTFPADLSSAGASTTPVTIASTKPGNLTAAVVLPAAGLDGVAMSSWALYDQANFSAVDESGDGYDGEDAVTRLQRLAVEEGMELEVTGGSSLILMGPQRPDGLMSLLRACETADGGVLFDGRNAGLSYITEFQRYNVTGPLTLSATTKTVSVPTPTHDDKRDLNRATVSLASGDSVTFQQFDGPLGSDAIGIYETSLSANLHDTSAAYQLAAWKVHLGQAGGLRYPQLELDVIGAVKHAGTSSIATLWAASTIGGRIDLTNLRTVTSTFPPGDVRLVLEGWSETITPKTWKVTANCSQFASWDVGVLDTNRGDCGRSVTGSTMTTSSTTVDVLVSDKCNWSHAGGDFSVTIGGEQMTVTAVSGTAATTPALVAVGTADSSDGFTDRDVTPGLPGGGTAAGNLLLLLVCCRDTNALDTGMYITGATGWKKIIDGVNFAVFGKVHSGSETAPTVNIWPFSVIVGDTMVAQIASFSGKWGDPESQLIAVEQQLNASAQDIAYPAMQIPLGNSLAIWAGWKADDWTSVAAIGGATEIGEPDSVSGNDAGIVWDYATSASATSIASGSFTVTGGAAAISRGMVLALRYQYQTFTVTRGVNGITRAHGLGEEVHVTSPLLPSRQ
jgi:hypothetical protein